MNLSRRVSREGMRVRVPVEKKEEIDDDDDDDKVILVKNERTIA